MTKMGSSPQSPKVVVGSSTSFDIDAFYQGSQRNRSYSQLLTKITFFFSLMVRLLGEGNPNGNPNQSQPIPASNNAPIDEFQFLT